MEVKVKEQKKAGIAGFFGTAWDYLPASLKPDGGVPFHIRGTPLKNRLPNPAPHYQPAIELQILTADAARFLQRAGTVTPA
ncbi:hypothetical protein [Cupriavidus taiwanensis]|uniref:Uncharacterized protein n=1 Tax=Cupriavidus taiwanensis TaxID=164546 RepID=A0A7Z7JFR6_9BURK|nr:hypothetical protein [Cupriavidus taiwanensis]SOZ17517.1 hypothetical protein CBM2597_U10261 [Cupriavidus taiwanensis]SOZ96269.1 hypothetical protein CBM2598_U10090 [Cupriavidus taiwanensis]SPC25766.1 hypothetical protein CBM2594_U10267 [Cupriavidus taiwanensis]